MHMHMHTHTHVHVRAFGCFVCNATRKKVLFQTIVVLIDTDCIVVFLVEQIFLKISMESIKTYDAEAVKYFVI